MNIQSNPVSLAVCEGQNSISYPLSGIDQNTYEPKRNLKKSFISPSNTQMTKAGDLAKNNFDLYFSKSQGPITSEIKHEKNILNAYRVDAKENQSFFLNRKVNLLFFIKLVFEILVKWLRPAVELINFSFKCLNNLALVSLSLIKELNVIKKLNVNLGTNPSYPPTIQNEVNYNINIYLVQNEKNEFISQILPTIIKQAIAI